MKIKVNYIFGGFLFFIVLMAGLGFLVRQGAFEGRSPDGILASVVGKAPNAPTSSRGGVRRTPISDLSYEAAQAFTGDKMYDSCICYERAFLTSSSLIEARARSLSTGDEYTSVTYISGYKACRAAVQEAGGNYWAHGWELGKEGKFWRAKCPVDK